MELVWLAVAIFGLIVLFRTGIFNAREGPQATAHLDERRSLDQGSPEVLELVKSIHSLTSTASPGLEHIRNVGRLLEAAYPSAITTLQQKLIESMLPKALEGKRISWELRVRDVRDSPSSFFFDQRQMGGYWVEHWDHCPSFYVACQTLNAGVRGLGPKQSFTASGSIANVRIQWPLLFMMIPNAVVSYVPNDVTRSHDAVELAGFEEPDQTYGSLMPQGQKIEVVDPSRAPATDGPSYQTAPLSDYSRALHDRAFELFRLVKQQVGTRGKEYKGSFSISSRSSSETAAKIIIYERGLGRENGHWPDLRDGVYVLVRSNGNARHATWNADLLASSAYFGRLNPRLTLGIAPKHSERFAYFRVDPEDDINSVAELLLVCAAS